MDDLDPDSLLQRAVRAQQRVEQLAERAGIQPRPRRPNTVLGEPLFLQGRRSGLDQHQPSFPRRGSNGSVDFADFPSNRREAVKQSPLLSTATVSAGRSEPNCTISPPSATTVRRDLSLNTQPQPRNRLDVSALDTALHSPGSGSQPPNRTSLLDPPATSSPFAADLRAMAEREHWRDTLASLKERIRNEGLRADLGDDFFGTSSNAAGSSTSTMPRRGFAHSSVAKSSSQNNLDG